MAFDREFVVNAGARYRKLLLAGAALAASVLLPSVAEAQSVWGGAGSTTTTNDYNLGTNWSFGAAPTAGGQSAQFSTWSIAATFEGEFSNVTSSYAGKGVVRYAW